MIAPTYAVARSSFLDAATAVGATIDSLTHPLQGPDGAEIALDVARLGPTDARRVVVISSGVHGVEGFAGSALQTDWLVDGADGFDGETEVVLLHAVNPHGFSWVRRVTEDNVDLNRNFVDFDAPPPNPDYDEYADMLVPATWDEATQQATELELMAALEKHGLEGMQQVISGGQYRHPTGVFYGGTEPTWSHRTLRELAARMLHDRDEVVVIDIHTGLGPWGHGELLCSHLPGSTGFDRAADRFGSDVRSVASGESVSAALAGEWFLGLDRWLAPTPVTSVALEYGTGDPLTVLQALRADAWLHAHGDPTGPDAATIKGQVRAAFIDDDPAWLDTIRRRFLDVLDLALA